MEQIRNKNYQSAEHYGLDCQLNQLQEECGELIQAVTGQRSTNTYDGEGIISLTG